MFIRTLLISTLFVFTHLWASSQYYAKIPIDTSYYWRQFSICPNYDYQLRYFKDTVLNGQTYNKYGTYGRSYGLGYCSTFLAAGFLRQDTIAKKVMILDKNMVERPLYNFSKLLGDTLQSYDNRLDANVTLTVVNVSSALLNTGEQRKALWTSNNNCYVEGVGSVFGGIFGLNQPLQSNYITEQLMCFGIRSPFTVLIEGKSILTNGCSLVPLNVGLDEQSESNNLTISIFPNPSKDFIKIKYTGNETWESTIVDVYGQLITPNITLTNGIHEINLNKFLPGVYFLKITGLSNVFTTKIIKE